MEKIFSEEELIIPALFEIYYAGGKMTTSALIMALTEVLEPSGQDAEILFGRNDSRFSQKVRNLISHKSLYPKYVNYNKENGIGYLSINMTGEKFLLSSNYYQDNMKERKELIETNNKKPEIDMDQDDKFDGEESLEEAQDFDFAEHSYVSVENINCSIYELKRKYDKTQLEKSKGVEPQNGLILDETFQRTGSVWITKQKRKFVESILMDIPIPFIYLAEGKRGNLVVIDGRQRLTTLFDFLDNKFSLKGLEFFPKLDNIRAKDLVGELETYKTKIEDQHLYIIKIKMSTPENLKLQIFSRVNRDGTPLNGQEIRHALHQGAITQLLGEFSTKYNILPPKRMKDRYLILRYLVMRLFYLDKLYNYEKKQSIQYTNINDFLGNGMDAINTFSDEQISEIKLDFCVSYERAKNIFGESAFKLKESLPINMLLFELTLMIISIGGDNLSDEEVKNKLSEIQNIDMQGVLVVDEPETPFERNIKYHRDSKENFMQRIEWIKKVVEQRND